MDGTIVLGLAGILATLLGSLLAPLVTGHLQRAALMADRIANRRLDAYVDLLETSGQLQENAQTWSAIPLSELQEPPTERLRAIDAQIRAVGSDEVREAMLNVSGLVSRFSRELFPARLRHEHDRREGQVDTVEAVAARLGLGGIADEMTAALEELEAQIRAEMKV